MSLNKINIVKMDYVKDAIQILEDFQSNKEAGLIDLYNQYIQTVNEVMFYRMNGKMDKNLSQYYRDVYSSSMSPLTVVLVSPSKEFVERKIEFFTRKLLSLLGLPEDTDLDHIDIKKISLNYEANDLYKNIKKLVFLNGFSDLNCVMPVIINYRGDKAIRYIVFVSEKYLNKAKSLFQGNETKYAIYIGQILEHEILGHLYNGDISVRGGRKSIYNETDKWSDLDLNVFSDLRINTIMFRHGKETAVRDVMKEIVYSKTIPQYYGFIVGAVEALFDFSRNNKLNLYDHIINCIKKFVMKEDNNDDEDYITILIKNVVTFLDNVDLEKTLRNLEKIEKLDDIINISDFNEENQRIFNSLKDEYKYISNIENISHNTWLNVVSTSAFLFEEGMTNDFYYLGLARTYNRYLNIIVMKQNQSQISNKIGQNIDDVVDVHGNDSDIFDEIDKEAVDAYERITQKELRSHIDENMKSHQRPPGYGTVEIDNPLKYIENRKLETMLREILKEFGNAFINYKKPMRRVKRVVPSYYVDYISKKIDEANGRPVSLPIGQRLPSKKPENLNGIVMVCIDESGSMRNEEVAQIHSAIMSIGKSYGLGFIYIGIDDDIFSGYAKYYQAGVTNEDDFLVRKRHGGTGHFHRLIYDFDEIYANDKSVLYKSLKDTLDKISSKVNLSIDKLKKMWDEYLIGMVVITDGELSNDNKPSVEKWKAYCDGFVKAHKDRMFPLSYLSVKGTFYHPIKSTYKLYDVYRLK